MEKYQPSHEAITYHELLDYALEDAKEVDTLLASLDYYDEAFDFSEPTELINELNQKYHQLYGLDVYIETQETFEGTPGEMHENDFDDDYHMHYGELEYTNAQASQAGMFRGFVLIHDMPTQIGGDYNDDGEFRFGLGISVEYDQNLVEDGNMTTITVEHKHRHYPVRSTDMEIIDKNAGPNLDLIPLNDQIFSIVEAALEAGETHEEQLQYIAEHAEFHIGFASEPLKKAYTGFLDNSGILPENKLVIPTKVYYYNDEEGEYAELGPENISGLTTDMVKFGFGIVPMYKDRALSIQTLTARLCLICDSVSNGGEVIIPIDELVLFEDIKSTEEE